MVSSCGTHFRCWALVLLVVSTIITPVTSWTTILVKNVTMLGPQQSPGVTNVSRDGGYTALINGNIVWLFDDTECFDREGDQLSFISNTAAYSAQPDKNVSTLTDFGVMDVGKDKNGKSKLAILADTTVGTGGWIPFQPDELEFNRQKNGQERVAICRFQPSSAPLDYPLTSSAAGQGQEHRRQVSVPQRHFFSRHWYMSTVSLRIRPRSTRLEG